MSDALTPSLDPQIPTQGTQAGADNDTFGYDATDSMGDRQTTISTVTLVSVSRFDGRPMGASDLAVSAVSLATGGLKWTWKSTLGIETPVGTRYIVEFKLALASGDTINRSVYHLVKPR